MSSAGFRSGHGLGWSRKFHSNVSVTKVLQSSLRCKSVYRAESVHSLLIYLLLIHIVKTRDVEKKTSLCCHINGLNIWRVRFGRQKFLLLSAAERKKSGDRREAERQGAAAPPLVVLSRKDTKQNTGIKRD